MPAVFVLVLVALCTQLSFGFKMRSLRVEAEEDTDLVDALIEDMKSRNKDIHDEGYFDGDDDNEDNDDKEVADEEQDADEDEDLAEEANDDIDTEYIDKEGEKDLAPMGRCKGRFRSCGRTRDCCRPLKCIKWIKWFRRCI